MNHTQHLRLTGLKSEQLQENPALQRSPHGPDSKLSRRLGLVFPGGLILLHKLLIVLIAFIKALRRIDRTEIRADTVGGIGNLGRLEGHDAEVKYEQGARGVKALAVSEWRAPAPEPRFACARHRFGP